MRGEVTATFRRASNWARCITFFGEGPIVINGVDYSLQGVAVVETPEKWVPRWLSLYRSGRFEDATPAAARTLRQWAAVQAEELARDDPEAFAIAYRAQDQIGDIGDRSHG